MQTGSLDITLVSPLSLSGAAGSLQLEQEGWGRYVGYLTRVGVVAYLKNLLFGDEDYDTEASNCGPDADGHVRKSIFAYPGPAELHYLIGISHGEIGERIVEELDYAEVLNLQEDQAVSLKYPCRQLLSTTWLIDAYDSDGETLPEPDIVIKQDGNTKSFATSTYGALLVVYRVLRHRYRIDVPPRENAGENSLQSFVWAVWTDGTNYMEVSLPDDKEPGSCNNSFRGHGHIGTPGPDRPESVPPEDEDTFFDYCTQKVRE